MKASQAATLAAEQGFFCEIEFSLNLFPTLASKSRIPWPAF
jgi:hypothetical protein